MSTLARSPAPPPADPVVDDVTQLNPICVSEVVRPTGLAEIVEVLRSGRGPISVGGGRYSMGGQTACAGGVQIDMRGMNRILDFSAAEKRITVEAGIRWRDIQDHVDPHDLSIQIMQTYSNFTVGGSLSVNVHGRYVELGPLILSVLAIKVVLADGSVVLASPAENGEIFYGCIGGYGGLGVIVEATFALSDNVRLARTRTTMPVSEYREWFVRNVREKKDAVLHNGDIYPPRFDTVSAVTWSHTEDAVSVPERLIPRGKKYPLERLVLNLVCTLHFGKQYRQFLIEPQIYRKRLVHWRNYEASYDVAELEPKSRAHATYVLQEYFVPVARFEEFVPAMAEILGRYRVNTVNVSIRHALPDPGALLAWARQEVFAFVLYYKQGTKPHHRRAVSTWTRELVEAAVALGGSYYLPYQVHATPAQFHAAYPRATEYFALKRRLDPGHKLRNTLLDSYYDPGGARMEEPAVQAPVVSSFKAVYGSTTLRDGFYRFLQNVFHLFPEARFHRLIAEVTESQATDEAIYGEVQRRLPEIAPFLAPLRYALPALRKQQAEIARETQDLLSEAGPLHGYAEIGTAGRYVSVLRRALPITGPQFLVNDVAPGFSPPDLMERRGPARPWTFAHVRNYEPIPASVVPDGSVDLASMYVGLHHSPLDRLDTFVDSIHRILRPGGRFVLRDHDVTSPAMEAMVSLAHDVFNAGLGVPWTENARELRLFRTVAGWEEYLDTRGFRSAGRRVFQDHDPTKNALLLFTRT